MMLYARLRSFLDQRIVSMQNFPVTHLVIIVMTVFWMICIESDYYSVTFVICSNLLLTGALVAPLTLIKPRNLSVQAVILLIGVIFYVLLPYSIETASYAQRVWIIGSILVARIVPSLYTAWIHRTSQETTRAQITHRWISLLQGVVGWAIVWGGIAASLASIDFLFGVTINSEIYGHVGVISMVCIGSWIWLINLQQEELSGEMFYPRWMRVFWQYIFLPLCVIYGLILISYGIKILATGQWPEGQLVYMVTGYVWFGLLTWFALLPLEQKNSRLHNAYRILFASFLITSLLMIAALVIRVEQYGWTIDRALVVALIVWIISVSIWSLVWVTRRWIIGLGGFVLIVLISIRTIPSIIQTHHLSQTKQLISTAQSNTGDATKLYSSMSYLIDNYGTWWTDEVFTQEQLTALSGINTRDFAAQAMSVLGVSNYEVNDYRWSMGNTRTFYSENKWNRDITWYSKFLPFQSYRDDALQATESIQRTPNSNTIAFTGTDIVLDLTPHVEEWRQYSTSWNPQQAYLITGENYQFIILQANSNYDGSGFVDGLGGYLFLKDN